MGLIPRFTSQQTLQQLRHDLTIIENGIFRVMAYVGEQFVKDARQGVNINGLFPKGDYTDRTANLRNSIGYFILKDGEIMFNSSAGNNSNQLKGLAEVPNKSGYELVGVAGMEYASYVENMGYNVISSQAGYAIISLTKKLQQFRDRMAGKNVDVGFDLGDLEVTGVMQSWTA